MTETMTPPQTGEPVIERMRSFLFVLLLLGIIGAGAELLLIGHAEDTKQLIPLVLLGLSLVVMSWHRVSSHRASIITFRWLMVLFLVSGVLGMMLHYNGNVEFALELHPSLSGLELFWKALRGGIPIFGPAIMIELGLLGLISTYRHPKLRKDSDGKLVRKENKAGTSVPPEP